jgi:hypothetical protein
VPRKLKVFRTPTGFHDAYVAAPSRKAALEAWGAEADLFARGSAEQVTDARLTAEPLARPGEVIRVSRGDLAAQLKALGPKKRPVASKKHAARPERQPAKPKPPPRRDKVDQAEAALEQARRKQAGERAGLEKQRDAIERKLDALDARHDKETARLEERFDRVRAAYRAALQKWSG